MTSPAQRRLQRDFKKIEKEQEQGIIATPEENNIFLWEAIITGPDNTAWEGGTFYLELKFNEEYPNKPPTVVFKSEMFHPNIYKDGRICLDSTFLSNKYSFVQSVESHLRRVSHPNLDQIVTTRPEPSVTCQQ